MVETFYESFNCKKYIEEILFILLFILIIMIYLDDIFYCQIILVILMGLFKYGNLICSSNCSFKTLQFVDCYTFESIRMFNYFDFNMMAELIFK